MRSAIAVLSIGLLMGTLAGAHAKLPAVAPKGETEKAAEAQKAAAEKARNAELLRKAHDRAAANYRRNRGADHSRSMPAHHEPTRKEQATQMPLPGQANDHSSPARQSGKPGQ